MVRYAISFCLCPKLMYGETLNPTIPRFLPLTRMQYRGGGGCTLYMRHINDCRGRTVLQASKHYVDSLRTSEHVFTEKQYVCAHVNLSTALSDHIFGTGCPHPLQ